MSIPITFIVDDPGPLINVFWWHVAERSGTDRPTLKSGEPVVRDVPVGFIHEFADVCARWTRLGAGSTMHGETQCGG